MKIRRLHSESPVAPPVAPTKSPSKAPPKQKPDRKPQWDPLRPVKPAKKPRPKAVYTEAYDDEAHQRVRSFWTDIRQPEHGHAYSKHPLMAVHGDELSRKSFAHTSDRSTKHGQFSHQHIARLLQHSMRIEQQHVDELIALAKKVVAEMWGVPESIFDAQLGDMEADEEIEDEQEYADIDPETVRGEINKRITMNAITHGSAVHGMMAAHHLVRNELNQIDRTLVKIYDIFAAGSHKEYWLNDMAAMYEMMPGGPIGVSDVEYDEEDEPVIKARAISFPVLVQELSKGVMELLSHHGLSHLNADELNEIFKHSEPLADEQWLIQIGPEIWRRFLQLIPSGTQNYEVVAKLSALGHEKFNDFIMTVVDNPEKATSLFDQLLGDQEEEDYEPPEQEYEYE